MKFVVAQLGARMHYAIPRILQETGSLERFFTDICAAGSIWQTLDYFPKQLFPKSFRSFLNRVPQEIEQSLIKDFPLFGLEYAYRLKKATSSSERTGVHLWAGEKFCKLILSSGLEGASGVYTFNSAGLELLRQARSLKIKAIMEQTIAPRIIIDQILSVEREKHLGWETNMTEDVNASAFAEREQAEWEASSNIICGSDFVKRSIKECGGPAEKCIIVPYGVDSKFSVKRSQRKPGPLRVLTVGMVSLRKGSPYVLGVAKKINQLAEFRMVGPVQISSSALCHLREYVDVIGPVPRSEIINHFHWADVFLLPSMCEGSATVVYESLASGLPVICTPNTGSIVRDGLDGYVVANGDIGAIEEKIHLLANNKDLLDLLSLNAENGIEKYSLNSYSRRLSAAII